MSRTVAARRAALMRVRATCMAQPVRREPLLQPRSCGGSREDLADALVGDRDDSRVGLLALSEELERVPGPPADPDGAPAVLSIERHVAARAVDVSDELPAFELHEFSDACARVVERLDDRAIARLLLNGGEQPQELDLFESPLAPARDDFRQAQSRPDVEAQCSHLEARREQRFDRRERPATRRGRAGQGRGEVREVAQPDRAQTA